jgi:endonuclease/exonuclease/phosphatase family metal-dependent hydrolase
MVAGVRPAPAYAVATPWISAMPVRALLAATLSALALGPAALVASPEASAEAPRPPATFQVASFNVLGSNHTMHSRSWRPGHVRARLARRWLRDARVSVAGLQEAQVDQMRVLTRKRWAAYPDPRRATNSETAQSVIWRRARWRLLEAHTFTIPFDRGQRREQPVVRLQDRLTGRQVWVVSVHMTAGGGALGDHERHVGRARLVREVRRLELTRHPVLVTGDMNDHRTIFCAVTGLTALVAASGGSNDGYGCLTPPWMRVDWIFGSHSVAWEDFRYEDGGRLDAITDHAVPVVKVTLG